MSSAINLLLPSLSEPLCQLYSDLHRATSRRGSIPHSFQSEDRFPITGQPKSNQLSWAGRSRSSFCGENVIYIYHQNVSVATEIWRNIEKSFQMLLIDPNSYIILMQSDEIKTWKTLSTSLATSGFPSERSSKVELWCFLCCLHEPVVDKRVKIPVICNAVMSMWHHCNDLQPPKIQVCWQIITKN